MWEEVRKARESGPALCLHRAAAPSVNAMALKERDSPWGLVSGKWALCLGASAVVAVAPSAPVPSLRLSGGPCHVTHIALSVFLIWL